MGSTQVYHDPSFLREVWVLFGIGVGIVLARFAVRLRTVGWRNFAGDDYLSIAVLACYTADAIAVTITYLEGSNVDYTAAQIGRLTDDQVGRVVYGSKMELFAWYTYVTLIWSLKACMLFFFNRLTFGLSQQIFVKVLGVACAVTYLAVLLTISLSCRPIHLNWQVRPLPPSRCMFRAQNFYVCTILNVLTDAALLCIPFPMLWKLRISIRKKITIGLLLSSGIFAITAAIVRICKTFDTNPSALTINCWGVRETIASIAAVNAPILKPLFQRKFWSRDFSMSSSSSGPELAQSASGGRTSSGATSKTPTSLRTSLWKPKAIEMIHFTGLASKTNVTAPLPALTPPTERHEEYDSDTIPETLRHPSNSTYIYSNDSDSSDDHIHRSTSLITNRHELDVEKGIVEPWPLVNTPNEQRTVANRQPPSLPEPALREWNRERPHRPRSDLGMTPAIRRSTALRRNTTQGLGT
ncbi:hypothetical protein AC578_10247 [Pseudocercospora eumusae]|uniref:Rhodopsin domain-containing protein n=1 Tax=Pseudocercospora eumusae TaxID=321146 RepID=A0A139HZ01_9PEZI|nr:hypothetical protein AC578_10247 [Pseudocercospora eumusae]KXT07694.1 hypothetical protein AC578_10247 [Pseudocercospora eumusae]KXT07698.1 hypothetical protein AC578_10247 [Pseudocercospora eumusae]